MNRCISAALFALLISSPAFAAKKAAKPAEPAQQNEQAIPQAGTMTVTCYLESVSKEDIYKVIDFDSELTKDQKLQKKAAVPLSITLHVPPSVIERKDAAIAGGSLSMAGENYRGPAAVKSQMRYVPATKSLEAEVESNGNRYTFTLHQIKISTFSMPPAEKLQGEYEAFGKILNYSCQIPKEARNTAGASGPKSKPEVFSAFEE